MIKYKPYPSDKPDKKYFIITDDNKKVYFGQSGYNDYTIYYKKYGKEIAEQKKKQYIARHSKMGENWGKSGINTPGFWSVKFLWSYPTKQEAYKKIKDDLLKWGVISKEQYNQYVF